MFDRLEKHHLGFVIPSEDREAIENRCKKSFVYDPIQETYILFDYNQSLHIYIEYICCQGRVKHHKPGFAHICYKVKDRPELERADKFIQSRNLGFKLTNLEKSASEECGYIIFYFLKDIGVIELNLME